MELRKQVADAHDVLIKEYIDDGYSGARLDRPALDQLRNDLKTPLFDTIYFLNTDRIARDVTYQTIIIDVGLSEVLLFLDFATETSFSAANGSRKCPK